MRALVPVKRVIDYNVRPIIKADQSGVDLQHVKMSMNPFCEIALEEAVRLKENGHVSDILAVTIGPETAQETARAALALGADRAMLVCVETEVESLAVAKILKAVATEEKSDLILTGKQAIDDDCNQTGQMLAALLDWPQACFASDIKVEDGLLHVQCDVDDGSQTLHMRPPAVITADLRLNEPRYATLPALMAARKKTLTMTTADAYGVDVTPRLEICSVSEPPQRAGGTILPDIAALVAQLGKANLI